MSLGAQLAEQIANGRLSGRLWLYSNYHCNLACSYCLTESSPTAPRRVLGQARMLELTQQAADLGFNAIGITGGEPFLLPWLVEAVGEISELLPVTVLTNGTLFGPRRLEEIEALRTRDVSLQISLDRPDPTENDAMRGPGNFEKVVEAVPQLVRRGIQVRIASTREDQTEDEAQRLEALLRDLGVREEDHVVRPVVERGRAAVAGMGIVAPLEKLPPELTISVDGAFWSPFAPTYRSGRLETDLLLTRTTDPLTVPCSTLLDLLSVTPKASDSSGFV